MKPPDLDFMSSEKTVHVLNLLAYSHAKKGADFDTVLLYMEQAFLSLKEKGSAYERALQRKKIGDFCFSAKKMQRARNEYTRALNRA